MTSVGPTSGATTRAAAVIGLAVLAACAGRSEPETGPPPPLDLAGARVMVVPVRPAAPASLDGALSDWLGRLSPSTDWVPPEQVEGAVARTPGSRFQLGATRSVIDAGRGDLRIADPLYGDLRRLGAILNAGLAFVPLEARVRTDSAGVVVDLTAALVSIRGGRVGWMHTVAGGPASSTAAAVSAAAESLARSLIEGEAATEPGATGGRGEGS